MRLKFCLHGAIKNSDYIKRIERCVSTVANFIQGKEIVRFLVLLTNFFYEIKAMVKNFTILGKFLKAKQSSR